jgi:hypothetical protein
VAKAGWHLAAYKAKADIEWDFKFATPMDKTWKDDFVLLVLSYPLIGLMIPGLREPIVEGFKLLASIDPNAPSILTYGWAAIFTATFGVNITKSFLVPGRFSRMVQAMGQASDDVPMDAAEAAQDAVTNYSPSPSDTQQRETP